MSNPAGVIPSSAACLVCGSACISVIDFGPMPVANGFLLPSEIANEQHFPLEVVACPQCAMVQLADPLPPALLFPPDYAFHSSTSVRMGEHFATFAADVLAECARVPDPFVVEIGSNDGILLRHVASAGVRHTGVEPAANVAEIARSRGVRTVNRFFDLTLATELAGKEGHADVIVSANVICHIADVHSLLAGIARLLAPDGVFVFEDPYLGDILALASFDQMYDEHVFYFSLTSVQHLVARHGLEVVDVAPQRVHGGSMRYTIAHAGRRTKSARVQVLQQAEQALRLREEDTYARFRAQVNAKCEALRTMLSTLRAAGHRVVGYAATSKSTTTIVYCGLTRDHLDYICDTTPSKQGRVSPGAHIPIVPHSTFAEDRPDHALLFAWNHRAEVLEKERGYLNRGGRFITYVPDVELIDDVP